MSFFVREGARRRGALILASLRHHGGMSQLDEAVSALPGRAVGQGWRRWRPGDEGGGQEGGGCRVAPGEEGADGALARAEADGGIRWWRWRGT